MELFIDSLTEGFLQDSGMYESSFNRQMKMSSHSGTAGAQELTYALGGDMQQHSSLEGFNLNPSLYTPKFPSSTNLPQMDASKRPDTSWKSISWTNSGAGDLKTMLNASNSSTILQIQNQPNTSSANIVQTDVRATVGKEISMHSQASELSEEAINCKESKTTFAQLHVIAERKRREKLCRGFIELSAIIPGLKKMDKATVLGDTIKYVKQLQDKVKCLEDQQGEPTLFIKKSRIISAFDCNSSSDDNFDGGALSKHVPELEVKLSGKTVIVKIHCKKHKGVLAKVLSELEELNLSVTSANAIPFTVSTLDITVTAQIEGELQITAIELAKKLSSGFNKIM